MHWAPSGGTHDAGPFHRFDGHHVVDGRRGARHRRRPSGTCRIAIADGRQTISNTTVTGGLVGVVSVSFEAPTTATLDQVVITGAATPAQELSCCGLPSTVQGSNFIR